MRLGSMVWQKLNLDITVLIGFLFFCFFYPLKKTFCFMLISALLYWARCSLHCSTGSSVKPSWRLISSPKTFQALNKWISDEFNSSEFVCSCPNCQNGCILLPYAHPRCAACLSAERTRLTLAPLAACQRRAYLPAEKLQWLAPWHAGWETSQISCRESDSSHSALSTLGNVRSDCEEGPPYLWLCLSSSDQLILYRRCSCQQK